jgi:hypothetical protein
MTNPKPLAYSAAVATGDTCIPKAEFCDARLSGTTATDRPGLEHLIREARRGRSDIVLVEDMDRICRRGHLAYRHVASKYFGWLARGLRPVIGLCRWALRKKDCTS